VVLAKEISVLRPIMIMERAILFEMKKEDLPTYIVFNPGTQQHKAYGNTKLWEHQHMGCFCGIHLLNLYHTNKQRKKALIIPDID
jgi:hypothetical protein